MVGAANGSAVAGGLELLLGCDVVIASSEARFGLPEVKRGLFPAGGGRLMGNRIPMAIALELTLTGELVSASRAYEVGLVNTVVAPSEVWSTAVATAERIAANGPLGLAASKELVRLSASDPAAGPRAPGGVVDGGLRQRGRHGGRPGLHGETGPGVAGALSARRGLPRLRDAGGGQGRGGTGTGAG